MSENFFGGRRGTAFIIKKSYTSYQELREDFTKANCPVRYDEYAIVNGNGVERGNIYRRGYDNIPAFLCNLSGEGNTSVITLTIDDYKTITQQQGAMIQDYNVGNNSIVPGKTVDGTFNDNIKLVQLALSDNQSLIGFQLPYQVIDFVAKLTENSSLSANELIKKIDDNTHPFYSRWELTLPKGVKGTSISNVNVITYDKTNIEHKNIIGLPENLVNGYKILIYSLIEADNSTKTYYLGIYNMIEDVIIADNEISFICSNNTYSIAPKSINSLDLVTKDNIVYLTVKYNNNDTQEIATEIKWINSITFSSDGELSAIYSNGVTEVLNAENHITWLTDVNYSVDTNELSINFNDSTKNKTVSNVFKSIKQIEVVDTTDLKITYNIINEDGSNAFDIFSNIFFYVTNVSVVNENNVVKLVITYNDGSNVSQNLYFPSDINIDVGIKEGEGTQKIKVSYSNTDGTINERFIGNPINYIMRTAVTEQYHLLILYSDPERRKNTGTVSYDGIDGWVDLGVIKDNTGLLISGHLNYISDSLSNINTIPDVINALNTQYPNGLLGADKGRIVTAGTGLDTSKTFYAYDYSSQHWYYLGSLQSNLCIGIGQPEDESAMALPQGSILFIPTED